jgi:hypothetical protein
MHGMDYAPFTLCKMLSNICMKRRTKRSKKRRIKRRKKEKRKEQNDDKEKEQEEDTILKDFSACMFEYEDIVEFEQEFDLMRKKGE